MTPDHFTPDAARAQAVSARRLARFYLTVAAQIGGSEHLTRAADLAYQRAERLEEIAKEASG